MIRRQPFGATHRIRAATVRERSSAAMRLILSRPLHGFGAAVIIIAAIGTAHLSAGCTSVRNYEPSIEPQSLDGITFLHYLGTVPVVSVDEGCRAILLAADGAESLTSYEDRYDELVRRGYVRTAWKLQPADVLTKGTLAFMAAKVCDLPPSVNSTLLGSWGLGDRRYAMKDAVAAGLMPYDVPDHAVRGGELVTVLSKIDEYMAAHGAYKDAPKSVDRPDELQSNRSDDAGA